MKRCRRFHESIELHAGGDLDSDSRAKLEKHLEHCIPCSSELAKARSMYRLLEKTANDTFRKQHASIWPHLQSHGLPPASQPVSWLGWLPSGGMATACLLLLFSVRMTSLEPRLPDPSQLTGPALPVTVSPSKTIREPFAGNRTEFPVTGYFTGAKRHTSPVHQLGRRSDIQLPAASDRQIRSLRQHIDQLELEINQLRQRWIFLEKQIEPSPFR